MRTGRWKKRLIMGMLLTVLLGLAGCPATLLLSKVKELVLTGKWDEGVFDTSIFGE